MDGHEFLLCLRDLMREYGMAGTGSAWGDLAVSTERLKMFLNILMMTDF